MDVGIKMLVNSTRFKKTEKRKKRMQKKKRRTRRSWLEIKRVKKAGSNGRAKESGNGDRMTGIFIITSIFIIANIFIIVVSIIVVDSILIIAGILVLIFLIYVLATFCLGCCHSLQVLLFPLQLPFFFPKILYFILVIFVCSYSFLNFGIITQSKLAHPSLSFSFNSYSILKALFSKSLVSLI